MAQDAKRALNIMIPATLYNNLRKQAERKNISMAALVRMVCSEWIEEQSKNDREKT